MKRSIYTSLFNYSTEKFDLSGAFKNWSNYADEIVIATFPDELFMLQQIVFDNYYGSFYRFSQENAGKSEIKIVACKDSCLEDPLFDGKLKNTALQACSNEVVIQQDMDERIGGDVQQWNLLTEMLSRVESPFAFMLPVIDLFQDEHHYKDINAKWYLHLKDKSFRGPVNFAYRQDGTLDISKSDSCELIDEKGNLIPYYGDFRFTEHIDPQYPHIIHLGYLDLTKRAEHNKFRKKCWEAMDGKEVEVATTIEKLQEENTAKPHGLSPQWWL